jgi:hypothetical protein
MVCGRSAGSLKSSLSTITASALSTSTMSTSEGGVSFMCLLSSSSSVLPSNGGRPAITSKRITPKE